MNYEEFLAGKRARALPTGIAPQGVLSPALFPWQQRVVRWALLQGRAALFLDTGLGKTRCQLEWARHVVIATSKPVLILAPLAVSMQTQREGASIGIEVTVCRTQADVRPGINITNYEMLDHFTIAAFGGIVLDESSILKAFDGKTRTLLVESFRQTPYRLACSATPAPNDYTELGSHAAFLGVMTHQEMLAMYFVHDGESTQEWRLKGHAVADFWRWVASWAFLLKHPRDLGYDDARYTLPPLTIEQHIIEAHGWAEAQGSLFGLTGVG